MEYKDVFRCLNNNKVRYLLCGGLAVNIYGIPRMTADIDILLDFTEENISNFSKAMKEMRYINRVPVELGSLVSVDSRALLIKEINLIAYSYFNSMKNIMDLDVLLDTPFVFSDIWERKERRSLEDVDMDIISLDDLIKMKSYANRQQDKNDVLLLSRLRK